MPSFYTGLTSSQRQCQQSWPDYFKTPPKPAVDVTNAKYGGWNVSVDRLFYANGKRTVDIQLAPTLSSNKALFR